MKLRAPSRVRRPSFARRASSVVAAACLAFAFTFASPARADDEATATELFNAGRDLMKQGDFAAACPKLAESARLWPTVGALAKLGGCEEHEGRLASARAHWEQALNLARSTGDEREHTAASELARIDARVPKLVLTASAGLPADAKIRIDGLELGAASLGVALPVDPGTHEVQVVAVGKTPWVAKVEAKADGGATAVVIPALGDAPAPPAPTPAPPDTATSVHAPESSSGMPPLRIAALATAGAGVIALGIGSVMGVDAIVLKSQAHCAGTVCPDDGAGAKMQDAKSSAVASNVAFAVGGALAAGAGAMWLLAPRAKSARGAYVAAGATLGGVVVSGGW